LLQLHVLAQTFACGGCPDFITTQSGHPIGAEILIGRRAKAGEISERASQIFWL